MSAADSTPLDSPALVAAVVAGDRQAADEMWRRFGPVVRRVLQRILAPGPDVEDVVQECFLQVFRTVHRLENRQALAAYILTIATHVARSELKKRRVRRWVTLSRDGVDIDMSALPVDPVARQALARFYAILDRLGAEERTAFVLRHVEEMQLGEVAAALGRSLATTKRRLAAAWRVVTPAVEDDPSLRDYLVRGLRDAKERNDIHD